MPGFWRSLLAEGSCHKLSSIAAEVSDYGYREWGGKPPTSTPGQTSLHKV